MTEVDGYLDLWPFGTISGTDSYKFYGLGIKNCVGIMAWNSMHAQELRSC